MSTEQDTFSPDTLSGTEAQAFAEYRAVFAQFSRLPYTGAVGALNEVFRLTIHYAFAHQANLDWDTVKRRPLARVAEIAARADEMAEENHETEITAAGLKAAADEVIEVWREKCHTLVHRFGRLRHSEVDTVFCAGYPISVAGRAGPSPQP
jgi:hypothetical protein